MNPVRKVGSFHNFEVYITTEEEKTEDGLDIHFILCRDDSTFLACGYPLELRSETPINDELLEEIRESLKAAIQYMRE